MNMKTVKVSDLIGPALDWAAAKCEGYESGCGGVVPYSTDWAQGGPIIEREFIELRPGNFIGTKEYPRLWAAWGQDRHGNRQQGKTGPTPLIAAIRCYIASKLGDTVEIPEELLK